MKKEVLFAISLGFIVGLIITFGIYRANQALKKSRVQEPPTAEALPQASADVSAAIKALVIDQPENNIVLDTADTTVSGQAEPGTSIAIIGEENEDLMVADNQGFFSSIINLVSGLNEIKIIATNNQGKQEEKLLNIIYSTSLIK